MTQRKPFEGGKNSRQLGIDTSRTFVVLDAQDGFDVGTCVTLYWDDISPCPKFLRVGGNINDTRDWNYVSWSCLAYADAEPQPAPEAEPQPKPARENSPEAPYVPRVGDRISMDAVVESVGMGSFTVVFDGMSSGITLADTPCRIVKLLSRPKPKRKVTQAEVNERFGEEVEIIGE